MTTPSKDIVEPILATVEEPIVAAIHSAWGDWLKSPHIGVWRCKRSRANFVWEQIVERAHHAFAEVKSVRVMEGQETYGFLVEDRVLFRFKKANENGYTSNVPTQMALSFHDHDTDLFGLPKVVRVEVAYTLNRLETDIADIIVVARDGDAVVWTYSLLDRSDGVIPLPVPQPAVDPASRPAARLVRPREVAPGKDEKKRN